MAETKVGKVQASIRQRIKYEKAIANRGTRAGLLIVQQAYLAEKLRAQDVARLDQLVFERLQELGLSA